ncbi:MAG: GGDEF domain-containing protein, partial [Hungatella sp.]
TRNTKTIFCFSVIIIGGLMDMLLFTAERNRYHNVFFLNLGILVYMAQQSYLYLERFIEQIESITRENYYKNLAFQDVLTGCYSRLAYEIDKSKCPKSEVWTAFSFDINDLKKMNDLHGHAEGDRLLHTFGTLLILVFGNYGKCYRIGGDEFVVFCRNLSDPDCEELLLRLTKETAHLNGIQSQKLPISYAVGTYSTKDTKGDFEKAIFLSDEQMYENKKQIKSGNPGILP